MDWILEYTVQYKWKFDTREYGSYALRLQAYEDLVSPRRCNYIKTRGRGNLSHAWRRWRS